MNQGVVTIVWGGRKELEGWDEDVVSSFWMGGGGGAERRRLGRKNRGAIYEPDGSCLNWG